MSEQEPDRYPLAIDPALQKEAVKEALHEWLDEAFAAFADAAYNLGPKIACDTRNSTAARLLKAGVAKTYQADPDSVGKLQNMLAACSGAQATPAGFYWLCIDNTQEPFTYADLQGLAAAMGAQGFTAFAHLQTLKAEVRAATDPAAVAAIVW